MWHVLVVLLPDGALIKTAVCEQEHVRAKITTKCGWDIMGGLEFGGERQGRERHQRHVAFGSVVGERGKDERCCEGRKGEAHQRKLSGL